jgi:tetratricopeptide (TPR) repeat protein
MVRSRLLPGVATLATVLAWTAIAAQDSRPATPHDPSAAADWRARGVQSGYNLDRAEAIAAFRRAIDADPSAPASHRLLAATAWTALLFDQGAITIEDYLGTAQDVPHAAPDPTWNALFRSSIDRAVRACGRTRARTSRQRRCAISARRHRRASSRLLGDRRRSRRRQSRLHPARVSRARSAAAGRTRTQGRRARGRHLPLHRLDAVIPKRVGAYLAGLSGGRDEGLRLVEAAASYRSDAQPQAKFTLILLYTREKRYDDALRVIRELKEQFPRNRLLWLEEGSTLLRAGRADAAGDRSQPVSPVFSKTPAPAPAVRSRAGATPTGPRSTSSTTASPRSVS